MEHNHGYLTTYQNADVVSQITGIPLDTVKANLGWVALCTHEVVLHRWDLVPSSVAMDIPGFTLIQTRFDEGELPKNRDLEEIEVERANLERAYHRRMRELDREYQKALLDLE